MTLRSISLLIKRRVYLHCGAVQVSIRLRSRSSHGGTFASVENPKVYSCAIDDPAHDAIQGVHLPDQVTFTDASNGWIA